MATNELNETFIKWCIQCVRHDNCDLVFNMINDKSVYDLGFVYKGCTLLIYIIISIFDGSCSKIMGTNLAIKLIDTGKSNHLHKMDNKTALYYAYNYHCDVVAMELIKKGVSPSDRSLKIWSRVMTIYPTLAIPLIMSGYCDNNFFETRATIHYSDYEYTKVNFPKQTPILQQLKYALQKNRVVQQMSRGRLILALKHYFKEGPYYPVDYTNSIYGKEYRKAMVRLGNK